MPQLIAITTVSQVVLLTNHHKPIITGGKTYQPSYFMTPINSTQYATPQADMIVMQLVHNSSQNFYNAQLEVFDYNIQTDTIITPAQFYGTVCKIYSFDRFIQIHAVSTKDKLKSKITRTYAPTCQAVWGDSRCGINKNLHREHIQITQINSTTVFYTVLNGTITTPHAPFLEDFLGQIIPIITMDINTHTFTAEPFYVFEMGQTYYLYAGCNRTRENCIAYNNFDNYLGFS